MNKKAIIIILGSVFFFSGFAQIPSGYPKPDSSQITVEKIIDAKLPVLIDFWAAWCHPCKILSPIIQELKDEYKGRITVLKINVDTHQQLSQYFRVQAIPTVFLLKNKVVLKMIPGVQSKEVYVNAINEIITGPSSDSTRQEKDP